MIWELIATVCAGLGAAGIALMLRKITKNKTPRWFIPAFAGLAMLGFQVQGEYAWFKHTTSRLPAGFEVVKTVSEQTFWRPWSYIEPQILRFIAADIANTSSNSINPDIKVVMLYFYERRALARAVPQVIHCQQFARTDFTQDLAIPEPLATLDANWQAMNQDDPLLKAVCNS